MSSSIKLLWTFVTEAWNGRLPLASGSRPETLRREAIEMTARIVLIGSLVCMPVTLYLFVHAMVLPFIISLIGMASGVLALSLLERRQFEMAASLQVYAVMVAGMMLTLENPVVADFGLALALLGPVHASLLTRTPVKKRAWSLLVLVVTAGVLGNLGLIGWPEPTRTPVSLVGAGAFTIMAVAVACAASRLNSVFDVYERGQINAYRHLIEHVQDAVMRFGADGSVLFVSRSSETLLGCRRFELTGGGLVDRIHVMDRPAYLTAFAEANADGHARRVDVRMRRDDPVSGATVPQFIWVEVSFTPVVEPNAPDARHEVVAMLRDVTQQHDYEAEMQRARRLAEDASNAKSRFLATIGHELRTPLNAIVGFSEMMTSGVSGPLSAQQREYAGLINQSGQHLIEVVKMLLDMSRLEAGKFELQTEPLDPDALVEPCLKMVDAMARERSIRLMSEVPNGLPMLVADERACRQILINLLSNAIKFSHDHSVVTLAMRRQGRHLAISVTDHGIGMGAEAVGRIGEPFFQAQDGLARRYEGTGLGLSIVKGLVELHDGSLHASSAPGEGTVMTVLLPINGPETKVEDTPAVTTLFRDPVPQPMATWQNERKRAL